MGGFVVLKSGATLLGAAGFGASVGTPWATYPPARIVAGILSTDSVPFAVTMCRPSAVKNRLLKLVLMSAESSGG